MAAAQGLHFVPSFHPHRVLGVATYALELLRAVEPLDAVYVGVGMGSGICGLIAVRNLLGLTTEMGASRMVQVEEEEIAEAMRIYFDDTHQIAEGAGAAPLAALLKERGRMADKRVAVILSGGNIERARFHQVLGGATPSVG